MFQFLKNSSTDKALAEALGRSQAVIEFDLHGNVLAANDNFLRTMGYLADEVVGRHHSMFCDEALIQSAATRGESFPSRGTAAAPDGRMLQ